jgi:hypothetical protein
MGKRRRGRRPQGHPAKIGRRRERDTARRAKRASDPDNPVRRIVDEALDLTGALDAEIWGSSLLGVFWNRQDSSLSLEAAMTDYREALGEPLVGALAQHGGAGARIALEVIAAVDDGELGLRAGKLADKVAGGEREPVPSWVAELGEASITGAAVIHDEIFGDASTVFLEARHPGDEVHAVGVLIDNNLGEMATDILIAASIDEVERVVREQPPPEGAVRLEQVALGVAASQIHAALELTDMTLDPPVSEHYASLRALALMRADEAPGYVAAEGAHEVPMADRDRLLDEFLSSPEGAGFAADGDEAYAASLAIKFCAGYVDGRPLRWSPIVVELFMADWIPRKVLARAELLDRLPAALDAWVRFAGRKSNIPEWAIAATQNAIPMWTEEMVERSNDPDAGGPGKQFLSAANGALGSFPHEMD